ncbi:hypothetical protein GGF41_000317 [Coemansia sp. RSA 2531]|nr:hypothetical protein GGF41_000317 [Coemansia sp. RSA 2531]
MPGEGVDSIVNNPAADLAIPVAVRPKYVVPAVLPDMLNRRKVIRHGLMSLRLSDSDITAYFGKFSRCTSNIYDSMWEYWAKLCLRNGINPCERSAMILNMFTYEVAKGEGWTTTAKLQIEAIRSIVEGQPLPERGRAGTNYARY